MSDGLPRGADLEALARFLRRAHASRRTSAVASSLVRPVVSQSWQRAADVGLPSRRPAPKILDRTQTARRFARHPLAAALPAVRDLLTDATRDAPYLAALSDGDGLLMWSDGDPAALRAARAPRFCPGHLCSEDALGTNGIGTALVVDRPVQIFSAEHHSELLHGLTCAAAPIHDPEGGEVLGVLNLSGDYRTTHPHSLALVAAAARHIEGALAARRAARDDTLRELYLQHVADGPRGRSALLAPSGRVLAASPRGWAGKVVDVPAGADLANLRDGRPVVLEPLGAGLVARPATPPRRARRRRLDIRVLGRDRAEVVHRGARTTLGGRQSELIALLALHPAGLRAEEVAHALYGAGGRRETVRAEMSRLRRVLGSALDGDPYRLHAEVEADVVGVEQALAREGVAAARALYEGPLLPRSRAPGIVALRRRLEERLSLA